MASNGEITAPCGVPLVVFDHSPFSEMPARNHLRTSLKSRRSPIRCSRNFSIHPWSMASKEDTTHCPSPPPPRRLPRARDDRAPTPPLRGRGVGSAGLGPSPRQSASPARAARRVAFPDPGRVDGSTRRTRGSRRRPSRRNARLPPPVAAHPHHRRCSFASTRRLGPRGPATASGGVRTCNYC